MTADKPSIARQGAPTNGSDDGKLPRLANEIHLLGVARADDRERSSYLITILHLIQDRRPRRVLTQVSSIPEHVEAVFRPRERYVDAVGALDTPWSETISGRTSHASALTLRKPIELEPVSTCPEFLTRETMTIFASWP